LSNQSRNQAQQMGRRLITKRQETAFDWLDQPIEKPQDEFFQFINQAPIIAADDKPFNIFEWWYVHRNQFPSLSQLALDTLSIPAMATECESLLQRWKADYSGTQRTWRGYY
jgi:hAT family C-terminal dimerisation region